MNAIVNFFKNLFGKKEEPKFYCNCPTGCCCGRCERCQPKVIHIEDEPVNIEESKTKQFVAKYTNKKSSGSKVTKDEGDVDEIVVIKRKKQKPAKKKDSASSKQSTEPKRGRPKKQK